MEYRIHSHQNTVKWVAEKKKGTLELFKYNLWVRQQFLPSHFSASEQGFSIRPYWHCGSVSFTVCVCVCVGVGGRQLCTCRKVSSNFRVLTPSSPKRQQTLPAVPEEAQCPS